MRRSSAQSVTGSTLAWLARGGLVLGLALAPLTAAGAQDDDLGGLDDSDTKKDEAQSDAAEGSDNGDAEAAPAPAPAAASDAAPVGPRVVIRPYIGGGITTRSFQRPGVPRGVQNLTASAVPAAEVGLDVIAWPQESFSLAFALHYRTALGLKVQESPPFALPNETKARSEEIELSVAPGWAIGGDAVRLSVPLGAIIRTLWPNVHTLLTPGYSLIGPFARVELSARISGPVVLRLGPEVQWIMLIDRALRDTGVNSQGLALGVEAALLVELGDTWMVGVAYRESHALASTDRGVTFEDVERYWTLRVSGAF